jgi:hypothetical protein
VSLNGAVAARCQYYVASVTDELLSMENWWNDSEGKTKPKYRWSPVSADSVIRGLPQPEKKFGKLKN